MTTEKAIPAAATAVAVTVTNNYAETEKVPQNLRSADVQRVFPAGKYDRVRANDAG